ncbi:MAG: iron chaperone [Amnibacterium sp.]
MSTAEIDAYLAGLPEPKRGTLEEVRRRIRSLVPAADEGISYALPAFLVDGKPIAGLGAFASHLAYLPHSGSVLRRLGPLIDGYEHTPGSLHFPVDEPLPVELLRALLAAKAELLGRPDVVAPAATGR